MQPISISLYLKPAKALPDIGANGLMPRYDRSTLSKTYGSYALYEETLKAFFNPYGLTVHQAEFDKVADPWRACVTGELSALAKAFDTSLQGKWYDIPLIVPEDLRDCVVAALGWWHKNPSTDAGLERETPSSSAAVTSSAAKIDQDVTLGDLATYLNFPDDARYGSGQTIAVLEATGGVPESYYPDDITLALKNVYGSSTLMPAFPQIYTVDGGVNYGVPAPGKPPLNPAVNMREVELDLQIIQALAPKATVTLYFYGQGRGAEVDALAAAILSPDTSIISWSDDVPVGTAGETSASWQGYYAVLTQYAQIAACLGITICKGCGDNGAYADGVSGGERSVYVVPSNPWILASGGVMVIDTPPSPASRYVVWNKKQPVMQETAPDADKSNHYGAGGGGFCPHYPVPAWQKAATETYLKSVGSPQLEGLRGIPDLCSIADGLVIYRDGTSNTGSGCSATGPAMAALIARINAMLGVNIGFITAALYMNSPPSAQAGGGSALFTDVTVGNNGLTTTLTGWSASKGWDPCTGLGLPDGQALLALFQSLYQQDKRSAA